MQGIKFKRIFLFLKCLLLIVSLSFVSCDRGGSADNKENIASWGTAELIGTDTANIATIDDLKLTLDYNGNALAVWSQSDGTYNICTNRFTAETNSWGVAEVIGADTASSVYIDHLQLVIDNNGNALVVWQKFNGTHKNIWAIRYTAASGSWGATELIVTDTASSVYIDDLQLAIDNNGNALVVWSQSDGTVYNIWANRYTVSTNSWGSAELIGTDTASSVRLEDLQLAIDNNGNALVVWQKSYYGDLHWSYIYGLQDTIWANRYTAATGSWSTPQSIGTNTVRYLYIDDLQLTIDKNGNALVVWPQSDSSVENIWANRYTAATDNWGTAELIGTDTTSPIYTNDLQVATDNNGNVLAVWSQSDASPKKIWANRYTTATGNWGTAELMGIVPMVMADQPIHLQLAIDNNGNAFVVWPQPDNSLQNIWANRYTASTDNWGMAELVEPDNAIGISIYDLQLDSDNNGNALVVRPHSDGTVYNVWANHYTEATDSWEQVELIGTDSASSVYVEDLQLAIDNIGNALVVWQQSDGKFYNIWANRFE